MDTTVEHIYVYVKLAMCILKVTNTTFLCVGRNLSNMNESLTF